MLAVRSSALCFLGLVLLFPLSIQSADLEEGAKDEALQWISEFSTVQMIFHKKDIARIHDTLKKGTEQQARQWLSATKRHREVLDGPRWKETQQWLGDFLKVQGIYSKEEIAELRSKFRTTFDQSIKEGNAAEFIDLLFVVEEMRLKRSRQANAANALRARNASIMQAQKDAAARKRPSSRDPYPVTRAGTRRSPSRSYRPPLISSLGVARRLVARAFRGYRRPRGRRR